MANKTIQEKLFAAACKVCDAECIASFECGKNKMCHLIPFAGTNRVCPLEKYEVKHDTDSKDFIESLNNVPNLNDLALLCEHCEHRDKSKDTETTIYTDNCFETHCVDCPVQICRDGIEECMAEADMS